MQTNAEGSSLYLALTSFVYSDLTNQQIQNHVMERDTLPPTIGEEIWSSQSAGKNPFESFTYPQISRTSPYPFETPKSVMDLMFDASNCPYEGVPFDPSTRWDVSRAASNQELQQSSIMNEWILPEEERLRFDSMNPGPSRFSKELSLSLATSHPRVAVNEVSELTSSCSLHKRHVGSDNTSCSSNNLKLNFNSCKYYTSGSPFFQAMQEILAGFACYALENYDHDQHRASLTSNRAADLESGQRFLIQNNGKELESKKKHLLSLLQVVDEQYNQCLDEIHTVISAFHAVTELDPNLHSRFALPAISFVYRNLRERISSHILAMGAARQSEKETREESSLETPFVQKQWDLQQMKKRENQMWRPQRGLPERSVSVLRAWMFQNFLHPYPKDAEKHLLALKSGLTRSQVSNWFINARVRLWKPMIEEMYAEMNRRKASTNQEVLFGRRRITVD